MKAPLAAVAIGLALGACGPAANQSDPANQTDSAARVNTVPKADPGGEVVTVQTDSGLPLPTGGTPMAQRVAVLGLLNKRNGETRELRLRPGQAVRVGNVIVRLRACERTADWEVEQYTGAFVQLDVRQPDASWRRVFSGWLYKERPALNVVQSPLYDVWPKACTMTWPDSGSTAGAGDVASDTADAPATRRRSATRRDSAEKSADRPATPSGPSDSAAPSAEPSNARSARG